MLPPHKGQRAQSGLHGLSGFPASCEGQGAADPKGKYCRNVLHQQAKQNLIVSPLQEALWDFCEQHAIYLIAMHLPVARNVLADHLSRTFWFCHEWSLHPEVVSIIFQRWGTPCSAGTQTNPPRKCYMFCSILGDQQRLPVRFVFASVVGGPNVLLPISAINPQSP